MTEAVKLILSPALPVRTPQQRLLEAARTAVACCWDDKEGGILYPSKLAKQDLRDAIAAVEAESEGSGATRFVEYEDGLYVKWAGADMNEGGVKKIGDLWETRGHFERYKERERGR